MCLTCFFFQISEESSPDPDPSESRPSGQTGQNGQNGHQTASQDDNVATLTSTKTSETLVDDEEKPSPEKRECSARRLLLRKQFTPQQKFYDPTSVVDLIKILGSQLNPKTVKAYYACKNFGSSVENQVGVCGTQRAALSTGSIGAVQQGALAVCIFFK